MPVTLRMHLGGHANMGSGRLFEREAAALVIRAGHAAGLLVRAEIPTPWAKLSLNGKMPAMDYGWYAPSSNKLIVAWELDGRDVGDEHIAGNAAKNKPGNAKKFAGSLAPIKIQVLYSVENALTTKPPSRVQFIRKLLPVDVRIVTDEELMDPAPAGIDVIMVEARKSAGLPP
jgi:hypothetical protein